MSHSASKPRADAAIRGGLPQRFRFASFCFAFACVYFGLTLPARGIGPLYTRAQTALFNTLVGEGPTSLGVRLRFEATPPELLEHPWQTTLRVEGPDLRRIDVPIDLRALLFLPTAAFVALTLAAPLGSARRNATLLSIGLCVLEPLLLLLLAVPLASLLGGDGPIRAFSLGLNARVALQLVYRALVAPPGMTYAIPLLLFSALFLIFSDRRRE